MGFFSSLLSGTPIVADVLDFAGGLLGMESDRAIAGQDRQEAQRQFNAQMDFQKNQTQYRVQDALKAGINPLAALGVSSNVSPTVSAGGSQPGHHMSKAMSALGNMIRSKFGLEKESAELDNEAKRLRNEALRTELQHISQPGIPINGGAQIVPGFRPADEKYLFQPVYDFHGRPRLMVNQDITENDSDNPAYISALKSALFSGGVNWITGKITDPQLRRRIAEDYYRNTGQRIKNLDELYFSPAEALASVIQLARGI